ncbi:hypothetical protein DDZ14_04670 [Maritimibacter sp. 55A14]|uniref:PRC-barrel domain-containing protein n=1 Tax=Maritimibacter sp. 55A14 TaxID=2174844 RepID=UPI000D607A75|nr:PRC-barrel domain-containing protein [Maritimibacter sp. 55A14]PWE33494.1 hypothetical protein DDZ14_04670 [Maritimibacter sp. 55A14]
MRTLAVSLAALGLAASPVLADKVGETTGATQDYATLQESSTAVESGVFRTRDIVGSDLYTTNEGAHQEMIEGPSRLDPNWVDIGDVEDIVLGAQGQMIGIEVDPDDGLIGSSDTVFLPVDELSVVHTEADEVVYVTTRSEEQVAELKQMSKDFWQ